MDDFVRPSPEFSVQAEESKASVECLEKKSLDGDGWWDVSPKYV